MNIFGFPLNWYHVLCAVNVIDVLHNLIEARTGGVFENVFWRRIIDSSRFYEALAHF